MTSPTRASRGIFLNLPLVETEISPCVAAKATSPMRAGSPGITSPRCWPAVKMSAALERARSLASNKPAGGSGRCFASSIKPNKKRMLQSEADVGASQLGQPFVETLATVPGRAGHEDAKPFKAALREGIEQRLLVGEMAARRGVADAQLPAEFAQGQAARARRLHGALRGIQERFSQVAVMVGTGARFHARQFT